MRRLFSIVALLVAALWLPATLHCGLETAGFLHHAHEGESDAACQTACVNDGCATVEEGNYKNSTGLVKVPAAVLAFCFFAWVEPTLFDSVVNSGVAPGRTDSPPELARTWQFTARTALLPGAPSFMA